MVGCRGMVLVTYVVSSVGTTLVENNVVYAVFAPNVSLSTLESETVTKVCVTSGALVTVNWGCCCGKSGT